MFEDPIFSARSGAGTDFTSQWEEMVYCLYYTKIKLTVFCQDQQPGCEVFDLKQQVT